MYHLPPVCPTVLINAFSSVGVPAPSTSPTPTMILSLKSGKLNFPIWCGVSLNANDLLICNVGCVPVVISTSVCGNCDGSTSYGNIISYANSLVGGLSMATSSVGALVRRIVV